MFEIHAKMNPIANDRPEKAHFEVALQNEVFKSFTLIRGLRSESAPVLS